MSGGNGKFGRKKRRSPATYSPPDGYKKKFANFIEMCDTVKASGAKVLAVAHPWVLGDDYEELIESLSRISAAELILVIAEPGHGWTRT